MELLTIINSSIAKNSCNISKVIKYIPLKTSVWLRCKNLSNKGTTEFRYKYLSKNQKLLIKRLILTSE